MEFYEDRSDVSHIQSFMVQKMLLLRGAPQGRVLTFWGGYSSGVGINYILYVPYSQCVLNW